MKSFYSFMCGVMAVLSILLFTVDHYGREFIQDYWISQLWYGNLNQLYRTITILIIFIDIVLIYFAGLFTLTRKKDNEEN